MLTFARGFECPLLVFAFVVLRHDLVEVFEDGRALVGPPGTLLRLVFFGKLFHLALCVFDCEPLRNLQALLSPVLLYRVGLSVLPGLYFPLFARAFLSPFFLGKLGPVPHRLLRGGEHLSG